MSFWFGKHRRAACSAVAAGVFAACAVVASPAAAQNQSPLDALRAYKIQAEWSDRFDATLPEVSAVNSVYPTLSPQAAARLYTAINAYSTIASYGGWPTVTANEKLRLGAREPEVATLRQRLLATGDLAQRGGRENIFDSYVDAAVRRFQLRHGIAATGVVDEKTASAMNVPVHVRLRQLQNNLARIEQTGGDLGDRYVVVNIPAAEIEAVEHGRVRSRHTAIVGKADRPSPELSSKIHEVNFNPHWTVPVSIIRKDLIPKMQEDPQYLEKNNIRIYRWGSEEELVPQEIDWYSDQATEYMFRQDPGEINSLGSVKINFHNQHQVYMHDTPTKNLFGSDFRFQSSGCVRVQNVREMITWLLQPNGWTRAQVDQMFRNGERLDVTLDSPMPVHWVYVTGWVNEDGVVHFRDDIYQRDGVETVALQ